MTGVAYGAHFFDFDHTLFDSDASEALAFDHAATSVGLDPTPDLFADYQTINRALWRLVEAGELRPADVRTLRFEQLIAHTGLSVSSSAMAEAFTFGMQEFGELYPGALEIVAAAAETGPTALVTNAISEIQRRRIDRVGIGQLFDAIVISSEVGVAKPSPDIFVHAFAAIDHSAPSSTLMIGDSLSSDIAGGRAAGLATCWFNPTRATAPTDAAPDHDIHDLRQILEL